MKNPFSDLIFMFFMIIFVLLIVYISSFAYQKKYLPTTLSNFQYSTYKSHQNLPEGIDSLTYAANLNQCPPGQCAVELETGLKRCPENPTSKLVYNKIEEACTRINFCDLQTIPYAVKSDGSATDNMCEISPDGTKIPCRCTNKKTCATHQLSKFKIYGGKINKTNSQNFRIDQNPAINQEELGYFTIPIEDSSKEFCQINPGFTDILSNGCNFNNSIQDRLGCQNISSIVIESSDSNSLAWNLEEDADIGNTILNLSTDISQTQNLVLQDSGLITLTTGDTTGTTQLRETIKYTGKSPLSTDSSKKYITLYNIVSVSSSKEGSIGETGIPDIPGFQNTWEKSKKPSLQLSSAVFEFCSTPNNEPNYKNMLLCSQTDNNVCKFGNFTYNFDKLRSIKDNNLLPTDETFTRNFCQFNPGNNISFQQEDFLKDPTYYTLSCAIGSGCNGKNLGSDPISEANGKYFPDVDINGINGVWEIKIDTFPNLNFKNNKDLLLDENTIQPGDFWSMKFINQNLISGGTSTLGGTSIIVQDLFGLGLYVNSRIPTDSMLSPGVTIGGTSYKLISANFDLENNKNISSISISPALENDLPPYSNIRITPPNIRSTSTYGIVTLDNNNYVLKNLSGEKISSFGDGIKVDLVIYKQFSFSGPNYVTKVSTPKNFTWFGNSRIYTNGNGSLRQYDYINNLSKTKQPFPLIPPENIYQLSYSSENKSDNINLNFYSAQAPFKIPMSMYYPVWNPVLFQQECIRCKPFLLSSPELTSSGNISNIIIQFCAKDFKNYQYNARDKNYCYVTTSEINFDNTEKEDITSQRLILKEPNNNVRIGDYVLDSSLQLPFQISESEENNYPFVTSGGTRYNYLQIVPQIFPVRQVVADFKSIFIKNIQLFSENKKLEVSYPFSFGVEESTSENFSLDGVDLPPNQEGSITYNTTNKSWQFEIGTVLPNNYFFGKKYQDGMCYNVKMSSTKFKQIYDNGFYFVPLQKVINISDDKKTILLDSPYPYKINQPGSDAGNVYVQFCRLDSSLGLCVVSSSGIPYTDTKIEINAISDSRITNIKITESKDRFLQQNLPLIKIDPENQNFL